MENNDLSLLILSCDKNNDLSPWINKTCQEFLKNGIECILATEFVKDNYLKGIRVLLCKNDSFDKRFISGLRLCTSKYVLVILDDYYVHDVNIAEKITNWMTFIKKNDIKALRVSSLPKKFVKKKKIEKHYYMLTNPRAYEIDFHPTIWNKESLLELIEKRAFSPWSLEPLFSLYLRNKKCAFTRKTICYDELIIRGMFFPRPFKKYCKQEYIGKKKIIPRVKLLFYKMKILFFNLSPYWLLDFIKWIFKVKSISSEAKL